MASTIFLDKFHDNTVGGGDQYHENKFGLTEGKGYLPVSQSKEKNQASEEPHMNELILERNLHVYAIKISLRECQQDKNDE